MVASRPICRTAQISGRCPGAIVLNGAVEGQGMRSFGDIFADGAAEDTRTYLIAHALCMYENLVLTAERSFR